MPAPLSAGGGGDADAQRELAPWAHEAIDGNADI
jgi:hypothetical protein